MPYEHPVQPKYTLTEAEQKTKPYLQNMPDDPGGLSYEELLKAIHGYSARIETDWNELGKWFAGLKPEDDFDEAVEISGGMIETDYRDTLRNIAQRSKHESSDVSEETVDIIIDERMAIEYEQVQHLNKQLVSTRRHDSSTEHEIRLQTELIEVLDSISSNSLLDNFVKAWKRGEPLPKEDTLDLVQEYCHLIYSSLAPEQALPELIAIRQHYGDVNENYSGRYRIGRMIAGCQAALGHFDEVKKELRSRAHESFSLMRRYTDFCLVFGFYEDLINFVQANVDGERHLTGASATSRLIMAYCMLGCVNGALPHLKARVNAGVRDQQLIDNIWSLKLRTGERPDGREVLSVQRSLLRAFGKKNKEFVAKTVDVLLGIYTKEKGKSLLQQWSEECGGHKYRLNLDLISIPGLLNPSKVSQFVKEHNLRYYFEIDVKAYRFIDNRSVKAFLTDIVCLAEDISRAVGAPISARTIAQEDMYKLLQIPAIRRADPVTYEYELPLDYQQEPFEYNNNYLPPPRSVYRFKELNWLIPKVYARHSTDASAIDETIGLCREQIALSYDMAHYDYLWWRYTLAQRKRNSVRYEHDPEYLEHYLDIVTFGLRKCVGFERLAIILEKRREYDAALRCVVKAKNEGWPGKWDKRILRLVKKVKT